MLAYGMEVFPLAVENDLFGVRRHRWPRYGLTQSKGASPPRTVLQFDEASVTLQAKKHFSITVDHASESVEVVAPRPLAEETLCHPIFAFVGAAVAKEAGREALHGAAVVIADHAWIVLAGPGGGKSTLASNLHHRGHPVLTDDLAVIDGRTVFAGPRACDLRPDASVELNRGLLLDDGHGRQRWREQLEPAPCEAGLAGFISLSWGEGAQATPAGVRRKLQIFAENEAFSRGPSTPTGFLELLEFPVFELQRRRSWSETERVCDLVESIAGAGS